MAAEGLLATNLTKSARDHDRYLGASADLLVYRSLDKCQSQLTQLSKNVLV